MRKCMIILFGSTGVGKTDFAEQLAIRLPGEIVNADLGQFYSPLSIGTAKPNWHQSATAQHLFNTINEPHNITAAHYRDLATSKLQEIWSRGNIPIIVGGSGFYLQSLFFPPQISAQSFGDEKNSSSDQNSWQMLYNVDPERALRIHHNDAYRINRALAIYHATGKKPSEYVPRYMPIGSFCFVSLERDRPDLYNRITKRTHTMLDQGWLDEVARLQGTSWEPFLKKKKLIGYDDILKYLEDVSDHKNALHLSGLSDLIAQKTRNYAKRQITFGNRLYQNLEKVLLETGDTRSSCVRYNLTSGTLELYINQLLETVRSMHYFDTDGHKNV